MADLSIIIPSHRRADLLQHCLQSVMTHAPPRTEVIVIDDGSLEAIVSRTARLFPKIRLIRHERPRGFCASANAGIHAARANVIELLNDDTEVTANWTTAPLARLQSPSVAAVAPLVLRKQPGPAVIDSAGDHYDRGGYARKRLHGTRWQPLSPERVESVSACAAFYRRDDLLAVGAFPESFDAYFDDVDLACRLRRRRRELWCEPSSVVWHHVSATYGRRPSRALIERQSRNEEWLYWRNSATARTFPRHLAVLAGKAMRRVEDGTLGPWLAGRLRAILRLSWAIQSNEDPEVTLPSRRKRRDTQSPAGTAYPER